MIFLKHICIISRGVVGIQSTSPGQNSAARNAFKDEVDAGAAAVDLKATASPPRPGSVAPPAVSNNDAVNKALAPCVTFLFIVALSHMRSCGNH